MMFALVCTFCQSVFAFTDIEGDPAQSKIEALQKEGIVSGIDDDLFNPKGHVTIAQGVHLIVQGLHLNIDNIRFIKEPKASDYYSHVPDNAWYAPSMIIAAHNGIELNRDLMPDDEMTREQFAANLYQAIQHTGTYVTNKMWIIMKDENAFSEGTMNAVQDLVKMKVIELDNGAFHPKTPITRSEAAEMLYNAIEFVNSHKQPVQEQSVTFTSTPVNDDVNKIVVSRGTKPHAGYKIEITGIDFQTDGTAVIRYHLTDPDPLALYAQVITEPTAETYVASSYTITLKQE
ncbi:S-layer homology domain-containing protein [Paenibacillus hexagrammi]|uniref:S-layer homology domain-containing protein n=1 Tax=Paenibacillus hexagrammi TaxID=2908839 RepID=A0ABY3SMA6_9BACL|nr:S-layer homology domain-containing protein [Paenibacillus sp. YPD9-1]UJF35183.1 S-layer homology domain-containing protein [Paenibacillus sp. YPD9-1]